MRNVLGRSIRMLLLIVTISVATFSHSSFAAVECHVAFHSHSAVQPQNRIAVKTVNMDAVTFNDLNFFDLYMFWAPEAEYRKAKNLPPRENVLKGLMKPQILVVRNFEFSDMKEFGLNAIAFLIERRAEAGLQTTVLSTAGRELAHRASHHAV